MKRTGLARIFHEMGETYRRCGFSRKCGVRVDAGLNAAEAGVNSAQPQAGCGLPTFGAPAGREPRIYATTGLGSCPFRVRFVVRGGIEFGYNRHLFRHCPLTRFKSNR